METLGIPRSSDARILFDRFAERFSPVSVPESAMEPRDIASIVETRGGDCKSLSFLLLNLLRWNNVSAELVLFPSRGEIDPTDVFSFVNIGHVLVYVPALDQYLDPTTVVPG